MSDTPWHVEAAEWLANDDMNHFDTVHWLHEAIEERGRLTSLLLAMLAYKDGRDAGQPKDENFVRVWLETARKAVEPLQP